MARTKTIAALTAMLALSGCSGSRRAIRVGSKNFTEQVVLGEIIAQHLERRLHVRVERNLNLGGTLLAHQALLNGDIDLYPEYTGTGLTVVLKDPVSTDPATVLAHVRAEYRRRFQLEWLDPLGIDNGFAMAVRGHNLKTLTDASKVAFGWTLGVGYEFEQRPDGLPALLRVYKLPLKSPPRSMDLGLLYKTIEQNQVDMIAANATDGLLSKMDLTVLEDDKHAFPPYQVCIVLRDRPELRAPLLELSGKFTNQKMRELNYQVDGLHRPVPQVAAEFLARP